MTNLARRSWLPLNNIQFPGPISISALVVQLWELAMHWCDEVEYLWKGKFNAIKLLYFIIRYGILMAQMMGEYLAYNMKSSGERSCNTVFIYRTVLAQITLSLVEIILLIRVYALYNQSFRIKYFLIIVFFCASVLEGSSTARIVNRIVYSTSCDPPMADKSILITFGLGAGIIQSVIFILSLNGLVLRRSSRTPLTSLMLKEGIAAFLLILGLLIVMMAHYELFRQFDHDLGRAGFAWYMALLSAGGSRLLLNMRRLTVKSYRQRQLRRISVYCPDFHLQEQGGEFYDSEEDVCLTSFYE